MFSIHCSLYIVLYTLFSIHCSLYIVLYTLFSTQRAKQQFPTEEVLNPVKTEPPSTYNDDISHYSEPFETQHRIHSRRISNASSCSGRMDFEESMISPSAKKFANLPITTGTTRFLQSMQATVPQRPPTKTPTIEDYNRSSLQKDQLFMEKNQRNQPCLNEYTPSPFACKTPELMPKSQPKTNAIKTLPKPSKALCQHGMTPQLPSDLDLPPPPPSLMTQNLQYQTLPALSKSRTLPPPPPKRDQSTKLSSKPVDPHATSIQTRNFILNLDRTIGQKKVFGAEGLGRVEMPLPPPPVVSDETSYIDLGELPPPPAELLLGLKRMRADPGLFQSIRRWPWNVDNNIWVLLLQLLHIYKYWVLSSFHLIVPGSDFNNSMKRLLLGNIFNKRLPAHRLLCALSFNSPFQCSVFGTLNTLFVS